MLETSSRWGPALTGSHGLAVKVNALLDGVVTKEAIPFTDGSVKVDRGSETRRSLTLTIPDPRDFPLSATDTFGVYGQRLYVERGIRYLDGTTELVPLGTFVVTNVSGSVHDGPLSITGAGLEILVKRSKYETAASTLGRTADQFVLATLQEAIPGAALVSTATSGGLALATKTWDPDTDRWSAVREVATAIGAEIYCDAFGTFRMVDVPDPAVLGAPVWAVDAGPTGVMVAAEVALSSDDVFNKVIVTGENSSDNKPPVLGSAEVTDPTDPLRYGGPFGKVTKRVSSSLVTTLGQAQTTAQALLRRYRQANRAVTLRAVPNPALDAGDWIRADYGTNLPPELHLVQSFEIPLSVSGGASTIATVSGRTDSEA
ncbi:minor tail protein [Streptomyces phage Nesbitt]|uniref:DUF5047 domain-containing protein n=3 Tax=Caudoviricetes TaxID=2731619 RepID=A0A0K1Y5V3_9CAUD|nr:tail protein [Streptomyces phage SF1]YP_009796740.1 tail protein [Streptomyces phage AbbeyMikolon]AKY02166.1 hypothetical protein SF1_170 [Streptomyces phage SF1]AUG87090.1 minor tail protein [Streptomyces phage AbbeyMikolon]AVO22275.1 minor tail protein [Streptomyces phage Nesbitt]